MKAINSEIRTDAVFYAVLWTFIPMLLAVGGVFVHFQIGGKETDNLRNELAGLRSQKQELEKLVKELGGIDSMMSDFGGSEEKYHLAMKSASPDESPSLFEVQLKERRVQLKLDQSRRLVSDAVNLTICGALLDQYQNVLNYRKVIRDTWKMELPPSSCPEMENEMEKLEMQRDALQEKLLTCQYEKINQSISAGSSNSKANSSQSEKLACEREKLNALKEVEKYQKNYNDLVKNLKEVLDGKANTGNRRQQLSECENKVNLIEAIIRSGSKTTNAAKVNTLN